MDNIILNRLQQLKKISPLGERLELIGQPADPKFLPANTSALRSAYPDLDNMYPTAYNIDSFNAQLSAINYSTTWRLLAYGNGITLISDGYTLYKSPDGGLTWSRVSDTWEGTYLQFCNGKFFALGYSVSEIKYSEDGENWTVYTTPITGNWDWVVGTGDTYVINGYSHAMYTTDNFVTSNAIPAGIVGPAIGSFYLFDKFIFVGGMLNTWAMSDDGINWNTFVVPVSYTKVVYGNGMFLTMLSPSLCATSTDMTTWKTHAVPNTEIIADIAFGDNTFVVITGRNVSADTIGNTILSTVNGIDWNTNTNIQYSQTHVKYTNSKFLVLHSSQPYGTMFNRSPYSAHVFLAGYEGEYVRVA